MLLTSAPGPEVVAEVLRLLRPELGLAGVEPPGPDPVLEVVLPDLRPDVGAGLRVGRVVEGHQRAPGRAPVPDGQLDADAPLVVDQQAELFHLRVVLAVGVDRGPDRHHQLHAEPVQFSDHRPGVGPLLRVELPVALAGPVEVVGDDDRERQPAPLVLAGDAEQLVLGLVAELALPEARGPLRQHRRAPHRLAVLAEQVRGIVGGGDPVVPLPGGLGYPSRDRDAQLDPADSGVVPEQAVSEVGDEERDADLGVALHQFDDGALLVEPAVLVLAEPVEALPVPGVEQHLEVVRATAGRGVPARRRPGEVGRRLGEQLTAIGAEETQLPRSGNLGGQPAVGDRGLAGRDLDVGVGGRRRPGAPREDRPGLPATAFRVSAGCCGPRARCARFRARRATPGPYHSA